MTEQFSQEYIAYILSDEARALRGLWKPKVGDWSVAPAWSIVPAIVLEIKRLPVGGVYWLPTLWQLLRIIEGAGWEWRRFAGLFLGWPHKPPIQEPIGFDDKDIMLAAAQLAVRAVEGK